VACLLLTVGESAVEPDRVADSLAVLLLAAGHSVAGRRAAVGVDDLRNELTAALARPDVDVVLIARSAESLRDGVAETVQSLLERRLEGFGELSRRLLYEQMGARAMLATALAGTASRKGVFLMPAARGTLEQIMERLVLPELGHLVGQLRRAATRRV
jgi:molybdenum cofactor biosynthesis protein B